MFKKSGNYLTGEFVELPDSKGLIRMGDEFFYRFETGKHVSVSVVKIGEPCISRFLGVTVVTLPVRAENRDPKMGLSCSMTPLIVEVQIFGVVIYSSAWAKSLCK